MSPKTHVLSPGRMCFARSTGVAGPTPVPVRHMRHIDDGLTVVHKPVVVGEKNTIARVRERCYLRGVPVVWSMTQSSGEY